MSEDKPFDSVLLSSESASSTAMDTVHASAGVATCTSDFDSSPLTVSGVAISENEVTRHEDGKRFWPAEQLRAAVATLEGKHLTKNHEHDKIEGVIGQITQARYKEGVGILFEAEVHDKEVAQKIKEGLLEVSVHAAHKLSHVDEEGRMVVEQVRFRDLSVVPRGAAEGNEVQPGGLEQTQLSQDGIQDLVADEFDSYEAILDETAANFDVELAVDDAERDAVYSEWRDTANMTAGQLRSWSENPCSREASVRPTFVIRRNLRLMEKPKSEWDERDVEDAKRAISFVKRMSAQQPDNPRDGPDGCPSPWAISLLNWGYNPFNELPSIPDGMDALDEIRATAAESDDDETVEAQAEDFENIHMPQWESTESADGWSSPNLEDFPPEYFTEDNEPRMDLVDNHFLYTNTEFPPENYTDLKFPVVDEDGVLWLNALQNAKARAEQADVSASEAEAIKNVVDELAAQAFDKDWSDEDSEAAESDDGSQEEMGQSSSADSETVENAESTQSDTMTEEETTNEDVEALEERVSELEQENDELREEVMSVRMEYADALAANSAFSAEELADNFTVEELSEKYEEADEVELAEAASEPAPQTGGLTDEEEQEVEASVEGEETDEEEVAELREKVETYKDMGWDAAAAEYEERLDELTAE